MRASAEKCEACLSENHFSEAAKELRSMRSSCFSARPGFCASSPNYYGWESNRFLKLVCWANFCLERSSSASRSLYSPTSSPVSSNSIKHGAPSLSCSFLRTCYGSVANLIEGSENGLYAGPCFKFSLNGRGSVYLREF